jgi:tetratricopeptide (TPR) repeat protein
VVTPHLTARHSARWVWAILLAGSVAGLGGTTEAQEPVAPDPNRATIPLSGVKAETPTSMTSGSKAHAHYLAGLEHADAREFQRAVVEYEAALKADEQPSYELVLALARAKRALGWLGEARLSAAYAAQLRTPAPEAHLLLGELAAEQGRTDAALAHLRAASTAPAGTVATPAVAVASYRFGELLAQEGYLRAAAEAWAGFDELLWRKQPELREATELAGIVEQYPHGLIERRIELLGRAGLKDPQIAVADWAQQTFPDAPAVERLYARTLIDAGRPADAFAFCKQRLAKVEDDARGAALLTLAVESARAAGALDQWVDEVVAQTARGEVTHLAARLARRLEEAGEYDPAVPLWRAIVAAEPEAQENVWNLAAALKHAGNLPAALDTLTEFIRRQPEAEIAPERLEEWMRSFGESARFLELVQQRAARKQSDFAAQTVLGMTAAAAGEAALAERLFDAALEAKPDFPLAHLAWARLALSRYEWKQAIAHADAALAIAPQLGAAHHVRGEALTGLDRAEEAEKAYKAALAARPTEPACLLALARHYRRVGNALAAQRYYQDAWSQHHLSAAAEELVDSYLEKSKLEVARSVLQQAEAADLPEDVLRRMRTAVQAVGVPASQAEHLAELRRQFEQHPEDWLTGLRLAAGLFIDQKIDDAMKVLERAQGFAPDDERMQYLLVRVRLARLEREQALAQLEELARRYPNRRIVLRTLADTYLADFRLKDAQRIYRRLLGLDNTPEQRSEVQTALVGGLLTLGDYDGTLRLLDEWEAAEPNSPAWPRARLRVLIAAERPAEALALARERLELGERRWKELREKLAARPAAQRERLTAGPIAWEAQPAQPDLTEAHNDLYQRRADYVQAATAAKEYRELEKRIRAWLEEEAEEPQLHEWLIELLLAEKRTEDALAAIENVVPQAPLDVLNVYTWRARTLAQASKLDEAVAQLNELLVEGFIKENPAARLQVRQSLVSILVAAAEYDRALEMVQKWLAELAENDALGRLTYLTLQRSVLGVADRMDEQAEVTEKLLKMQPRDPGLNNDLGYTWIDQGRNLERGFEMIRLAVAAEPLNAPYLDSLGWVYYKMGDFAAAQMWLARAVRLVEGRDATVYDHLGDTEYRLKDRAAAQAAWKKALELAEKPAAEGNAALAARNAKLIAHVRAKLTALEDDGEPQVAPIAAEQEQPRKGD